MREAPSRHADRRPAPQRGRERARLRSGRAAARRRSSSQTNTSVEIVASAPGRARGRRRARHRHRVAGVPQPGLRRAQGEAQGAGDLRRPQPVRSRRAEERWDSSTTPIREKSVDTSKAARAGGRRRDARPLLVRRGVAHLAGGAGAGGADRRARSRLGRRGERRAELQALGRAHAAALGGRPRRAGRAARAPARAARASRRACTATPSSTPRMKLRVIGRQQQLLRIDFEKPPSREVLAAKLRGVPAARSASADVVILSDYGKGGLTHIAEMIRAARKAAQARAGRSEGRRLLALQGREHHHAEPSPSCARSSGAGRTRRT